MDTSVALVEAYLNVNGYFTVAEYPVLEAGRRGAARSVTDLDILAFRFPGAGREIKRSGRGAVSGVVFASDPRLGCPPGRPDMIVGEVKEGRARFNPTSRNPRVLEAALARFGCCEPGHASGMVRELLRRGHATTEAGHAVRMVAFGMAGDAGGGRWTTVPMDHVVRYLQRHLRENWDVLRHAQLKDPAMSFMALLQKAAAMPARDGVSRGLQAGRAAKRR